MKNVCLLISLALFFSYKADAQQVVKGEKFDYGYIFPSGDNHFMFNINENEFIVYQSLNKKSSQIVKYDSELNELLKISLPDADDFPEIGCVREKEKIIVYMPSTEELAKDESIILLYDPDNGKLINSLKLNNDKTVLFSKNNHYFYSFEFTGKGDRAIEGEIFNFSLEKQGSVKTVYEKKETFHEIFITDSGNVLFVFSDSEGQFRTELFGGDGSLKGKITEEKRTGKKQEYGQFRFNEINEGKYMITCAKKRKGDLVSIDSYIFDFEKSKTEFHTSHEFNRDYIVKLYSELNQDHVLNKNFGLVAKSKVKTPKSFEFYSISNVILEDNGAYYVVAEKLWSKLASNVEHTYYFAEDLLISAFDQSGKNKWNTVLGRKMMTISGSGNILITKWTATQSVSKANKENIQLITCEYSNGSPGNVKAYIRKINKNNGEPSAPDRLIQGNHYIHRGFLTWLNPEKLIIMSTVGIKLVKTFQLNALIIE